MDGWFQMFSTRSKCWPRIISLALQLLRNGPEKTEPKSQSADDVHPDAHADAHVDARDRA